MSWPKNWMHSLVVAAIIAAGSHLVVAQEKEDFPLLPEKLSTAEFEAIDGQKFSLTDYEGKVVVIHLWAVWTPPY